MLGGELMFHFMNVMVMTLVVAPLVLWRYRRAVLAGMQHRLGAPLPVPAPRATVRPPPAYTVAGALAWETRLRRRIFAGTLAAVFVPSLLLAAQYLALSDLPMMPSHLFVNAAVTSSVAVPIYAVLTATPFWRAVRLGALTVEPFVAPAPEPSRRSTPRASSSRWRSDRSTARRRRSIRRSTSSPSSSSPPTSSGCRRCSAR